MKFIFDITDYRVMIGLFIGGLLPFVFALGHVFFVFHFKFCLVKIKRAVILLQLQLYPGLNPLAH